MNLIDDITRNTFPSRSMVTVLDKLAHYVMDPHAEVSIIALTVVGDRVVVVLVVVVSVIRIRQTPATGTTVFARVRHHSAIAGTNLLPLPVPVSVITVPLPVSVITISLLLIALLLPTQGSPGRRWPPRHGIK